MSIPLTGPVALSQLQIEFGGTDPVSLNEYYRGGAFVPNSVRNAAIPTSGAISFEQFRGSSKTATVTYAIIGGGGGGGAGRDDDGGAGYGLYATSGGNSSISGTGVQTITAAGGQGGYSFAFIYNSPLGAGQSTIYGPGGAGGASQSAGSPAPSTSYGAGGGGGGGDGPQTYDSSGNKGEGGYAGTYLTGTVEVVYGTTLSITIGGQGLGHIAGYPGANGAAGYCVISWDGNTSTFTSSGTVTLT
jgi:fibronectin-binding autotransporter adhesin